MKRQPYKFSKKLTDKLIELITAGKGKVRACKICNIKYDTFLNWMEPIKDDGSNDFEGKLEFMESIKKAVNQWDDTLEESCLETIYKAGAKQWQARSWILERKYGQRYKLHQQVDHTGINISIKKKKVANKSVKDSGEDNTLRSENTNE